MATTIPNHLPPKTILMLYPPEEIKRLDRNTLAWTNRGFAVIRATDPSTARSILDSNPGIGFIIVDSDFEGYGGGIRFLNGVNRSGMLV